ncbi:MAG: 1-deoxy-D-xylulose-5-phosphate reductoisomerase, partial [Oscillospiraceae bacterium]|nr:1-deoxy-D-xylulose-5-phosphate reductoisomerase [Candidatus Equicaccousia limihippi]
LLNVTPEMALNHPNWNMGQKVTIDSATLFNKGLEVIEAMHLFGVSPKDIEVVVHPQSIVHSAVEFCDNSVIAQMGVPDMKIPIQLALTYPKREECDVPSLSLAQIGALTFNKPDLNTFTALKTCINAANERGLKPCAANGADEIAVKLFLERKIKFTDIGEMIAKAVDAQKHIENYTIDDVFDADKAAKEFVLSQI